MKWLVDTSILVRLSDSASPLQTVCAQALTKLHSMSHSLFLCTQVMIEYHVVATRPLEVNGLGKTFTQSLNDLRRFRQIFTFLPEPQNIDQLWETLVNKYGIIGRQAHDTRLVAFAQSYGIPNLLTLNARHFGVYAEITVVTPDSV